jgi:4'-phosphopantetheinyl transferase
MGHVHVWRLDLAWLRQKTSDFEATLSPIERDRAVRYRVAADRERFIVVRAILRKLLGRYLGLTPAAIAFDYGAWGKPLVRNGHSSYPGLGFNVSHSGGVALVALAREARVGIDVELVRSGLAVELIAERHLSPTEQVTLSRIPSHLRNQAFFRYWTRKEAFTKAVGGGLSIAFDGFSVSLAPTAGIDFETPCHTDARSPWWLQELDPGAGYVAAVAVETPQPALLWEWLEDQ